MNVCTQLKRMKPDEYFAYLKDAIDNFKKTPTAVEFTFDLSRMKYNSYDESEKIITQGDVVEFLESVDVLPAFGTGSFPIPFAQFTVYKADFKGKIVTYCTVNEYRRHRPGNYNNENTEF